MSTNVSPRRIQRVSLPPSDEAVRLGNAKLGVSYFQGEFDGLCGLYSIINALTLLPDADRLFDYALCETLFKRGITFLEERGILGLGVRWGVGQQAWRDLVDHVIAAASVRCDRPIIALRHFVETPHIAPGAFIDAIEFAIRNSQPVIIRIRGRHSRYTVISGYTTTRLLLRDSIGNAWLNKAACTASGDGVSRHRIAPSSFTALELG